MNELTREWLDKAETDFDSADLLLHAGEVPLPDTAAFHCQQSAEKFLKAFLQEHQVVFERKHDLMPLLALCISLDADFQSLKEYLQELDRYAVAVRYPGVSVKVEQAKSAFRVAKKVRGFVKRKLKTR